MHPLHAGSVFITNGVCHSVPLRTPAVKTKNCQQRVLPFADKLKWLPREGSVPFPHLPDHTGAQESRSTPLRYSLGDTPITSRKARGELAGVVIAKRPAMSSTVRIRERSSSAAVPSADAARRRDCCHRPPGSWPGSGRRSAPKCRDSSCTVTLLSVLASRYSAVFLARDTCPLGQPRDRLRNGRHLQSAEKQQQLQHLHLQIPLPQILRKRMRTAPRIQAPPAGESCGEIPRQRRISPPGRRVAPPRPPESEDTPGAPAGDPAATVTP